MTDQQSTDQSDLMESSKAGYLSRLQVVWVRYGCVGQWLAVVLMTGAGMHRLVTQTARLLSNTHSAAAVDLVIRYRELALWFSGKPLYDQLNSAVYPPASYLMLWMLIGWAPIGFAKWVWAVTCFAALAAAAWLFVVSGKARTPLQRAILMLIPLSTYASAITIGNGQLDIYVLFGLVGAFVILELGQGRMCYDCLAALCVLVALIKPNMSAPFFWIILFTPGRIRSAMIIAVVYVALGLIAAVFQDGSFFTLHWQWVTLAQSGAQYGSTVDAQTHGSINAYGTIHDLLGMLGLSSMNTLASLAILAGFGGWVYLYRKVNLWLLVGVAAIVTRFWTYHRVYDDIIMVLPMLSLFRIANQSPVSPRQSLMASSLLAISIVAIVIPASLLSFPTPWPHLFIALQVTVWITMMVFLLVIARVEKKAGKPPVR